MRNSREATMLSSSSAMRTRVVMRQSTSATADAPI
jgi:hypothetical protein